MFLLVVLIYFQKKQQKIKYLYKDNFLRKKFNIKKNKKVY